MVADGVRLTVTWRAGDPGTMEIARADRKPLSGLLIRGPNDFRACRRWYRDGEEVAS